ncbi:TPA: hypothetical protein EYH33_03500, partial [Candidatus Bipolaricaulota bacterium]|nr:hypothetical protein [Candidatus Bipolaricaulota bacterium]
MRRWPYPALGLFVLAADRLTKAWVAASLSPGESIPLLGDLLHLTRVHNPGGALGLFPQHRTAFLVISGGVALALTFVLGLGGNRWLR